MKYLRQSTAATVRVGPFMDATDAVTPETGITLGAADQAEILKEGSGATVDISGATWAAISGADGYYNLSLTTSHTDTLGNMDIIVQDTSVCLPVKVECCVLPAHIYDALIAGTDYLPVTALEQDWSIAGTTLTARKRDGTTTQFTKTVTTNAGANPVTGVD